LKKVDTQSITAQNNHFVEKLQHINSINDLYNFIINESLDSIKQNCDKNKEKDVCSTTKKTIISVFQTANNDDILYIKELIIRFFLKKTKNSLKINVKSTALKKINCAIENTLIFEKNIELLIKNIKTKLIRIIPLQMSDQQNNNEEEKMFDQEAALNLIKEIILSISLIETHYKNYLKDQLTKKFKENQNVSSYLDNIQNIITSGLISTKDQLIKFLEKPGGVLPVKRKTKNIYKSQTSLKGFQTTIINLNNVLLEFKQAIRFIDNPPQALQNINCHFVDLSNSLTSLVVKLKNISFQQRRNIQEKQEKQVSITKKAIDDFMKDIFKKYNVSNESLEILDEKQLFNIVKNFCKNKFSKEFKKYKDPEAQIKLIVKGMQMFLLITMPTYKEIIKKGGSYSQKFIKFMFPSWQIEYKLADDTNKRGYSIALELLFKKSILIKDMIVDELVLHYSNITSNTKKSNIKKLLEGNNGVINRLNIESAIYYALTNAILCNIAANGLDKLTIDTQIHDFLHANTPDKKIIEATEIARKCVKAISEKLEQNNRNIGSFEDIVSTDLLYEALFNQDPFSLNFFNKQVPNNFSEEEKRKWIDSQTKMQKKISGLFQSICYTLKKSEGSLNQTKDQEMQIIISVMMKVSQIVLGKETTTNIKKNFNLCSKVYDKYKQHKEKLQLSTNILKNIIPKLNDLSLLIETSIQTSFNAVKEKYSQLDPVVTNNLIEKVKKEFNDVSIIQKQIKEILDQGINDLIQDRGVTINPLVIFKNPHIVDRNTVFDKHTKQIVIDSFLVEFKNAITSSITLRILKYIEKIKEQIIQT